jgi:hypothetical protein
LKDKSLFKAVVDAVAALSAAVALSPVADVWLSGALPQPRRNETMTDAINDVFK